MVRKKTKHVKISCEKLRNSTRKRRLDSLLKKAHELSVLCNVDINIIVQNPNEGNSVLWPSPDKVMNNVEKFLSIPERERLKKMVLQENLLMDKVREMTDRLSKLRNKNDEKEMGLVMNQLMNGKTLGELETKRLSDLHRLVEQKIKKIQTINDGHNTLEAPESTPMTILMQDLLHDDFSSEAMFGIPNNFDFWNGNDVELEPTIVASPLEISGDMDFSQLWQSIFSP